MEDLHYFIIDFLWLTASSTRHIVLPIFVTFCDAQNRSNNCNSYANDSYGLAPIAYISFFWILKKHPRYKSGPYLTQSVYQQIYSLTRESVHSHMYTESCSTPLTPLLGQKLLGPQGIDQKEFWDYFVYWLSYTHLNDCTLSLVKL